MGKKCVLIVSVLLLSGFIFAQPVTSNKISLSTKKATRIKLIVDTIPPDISFISPRLSRGFKPIVNTSTIEVKGLITDRTGIEYFKINGQSISISADGDFSQKINLNEGSQTIVVEAMDKTNHYVKSEFKIVYEPPVILQENEIITAKKELNVIGEYYALIIGVSDYDDPNINDLDKPIVDAQELYRALLANYTFESKNCELLKNPTREEIMDALDKFSGIIKPNDNFLIFYAGHGHWDDESKIGYWLPSDAKEHSKSRWFRNGTLRDYLKEVNSKHTLLITDACFGGGIFKTRSAFSDAPTAINMLYSLPSRKAMTSGTLTEVPDESVFIKYLVKRLYDNQEKYISSEQLFSSFRTAVMNNSDVIPQYGEINKVGDEGGDFIFIRKEQ